MIGRFVCRWRAAQQLDPVEHSATGGVHGRFHVTSAQRNGRETLTVALQRVVRITQGSEFSKSATYWKKGCQMSSPDWDRASVADNHWLILSRLQLKKSLTDMLEQHLLADISDITVGPLPISKTRLFEVEADKSFARDWSEKKS